MTDITQGQIRIQAEEKQASEFQTKRITIIVGGHFIHDTYPAFLAPLLPELIDRLTLTLTQSSLLSVLMSLPALLNIFIGYLADKISLHYFVIFAPAITGTLMSAIGFTNSYFMLSVLLVLAGISIQAFHVPAPAMIGHISGRYIGRGTSFFMAGGELGRTLGPMLIAWAVTTWGFEGIWRLAALGWIATAILYWQLHDVSAQKQTAKSIGMRALLPRIQRLFIPLMGLMLLRYFMMMGMSLFMVVFFKEQGYTLGIFDNEGYKFFENQGVMFGFVGIKGYGIGLIVGSFALTLFQGAGVAGALFSGTVSDLVGRKRTLITALILSSIFMFMFLNVDGYLMIPILILSGFAMLSITPVIHAIVLEQVPEQRATANGIYMLVGFLLRSVAALAIGRMGDLVGLHQTFQLSIVGALVAIPVVLALPDLKTKAPSH